MTAMRTPKLPRRSTRTEAVGYLSKDDERGERRRRKLSTLKGRPGWSLIHTHLLLEWRVLPSVAEVLRPDIDAVHIADSNRVWAELPESEDTVGPWIAPPGGLGASGIGTLTYPAFPVSHTPNGENTGRNNPVSGCKGGKWSRPDSNR